VILIADWFLRDSSPKDDLKSVLETRVALFCYGSSVIDDDVENFSLSLLSLARNIERKRSDDGKETMTNISFFSIFY
jgi:hypothetical protein